MSARTTSATRPVRALAVALAAVLVLLAPAAPALAYWHSAGSSAGAASTGVLGPPTSVAVTPTSGPEVVVGWSASTGPAPVEYYVVRTSGAVDAAACDTSALVTITATSCTDHAVGAGSSTYRVIAVHRSWTATSAPSGQVVVSEPGLLGTAASFSVLGVDATDSPASSIVSGDVGVTPIGAVVGFAPSRVGGDIHVNDAAAAAAAAALLVAYDTASRRDADTQFPGDPIGLTFHPGVHHTIGAMTFTGSLTLDALGDPNAVFIFQIDGAITTAANSHVLLTNGAQASNVYWQVNGASGHGADSTFSGTIMALGAITLGAGVELIGRALSQAAVTLGGNVIRFTIAPPPTVVVTGGAAFVTKDTTPTIAGTTSAVAGRPVIVTMGSQTLSTTVLADGTWSVTAGELAAGSYTVTVKIRDAAGNGGAAAQQLTVEVNPPTINLGVAGVYPCSPNRMSSARARARSPASSV